jgi:hypothetical protein
LNFLQTSLAIIICCVSFSTWYIYQGRALPSSQRHIHSGSWATTNLPLN